ncbi:hypothetical protein AAHB37_15590 [Glutamicibacter halophytocola]|uniref:hypothetical protein n=1 Tax=Glutamicibacter halophytocola TaxID=1933880 RepID=UPI00321C0800
MDHRDHHYMFRDGTLMMASAGNDSSGRQMGYRNPVGTDTGNVHISRTATPRLLRSEPRAHEHIAGCQQGLLPFR